MGLLFMHHAAGARLLADQGEGSGRHPSGGGARRLLEENGYRVRSATFGSRFGQNNFLVDWLPKFRDHMNEIVRIEEQDRILPDSEVNRIVMFKSCLENNRFVGLGVEPGDASMPSLTLANAKAMLRQLLPVLASRPDVLFVYVTAQPNAAPMPERIGKVALSRLLGRPTRGEAAYSSALIARQFHDWVVAPNGWLGEGGPRNVVVFDLYDYLTKQGSSAFLEYDDGEGLANASANQAIAELLVPFLNRAVHRAKLVE